MRFPECKFTELVAEPPRNGIYKSKKYIGQGIKLIRMGELFRLGEISPLNADYQLLNVTATEAEKLKLKDGDLLFSRTSVVADGVGKCSILRDVNQDIIFDSNIVRIRPDPNKVNSKFLYYYFNSELGRSKVKGLSGGAAVTTITGPGLLGLNVPCPSMEEQRRIINILSSYDNLIENNNHRIAILEEMAQSLYREWFVNFRFPGHEITKFIDSPLGKFPKGWEIKSAADVIDINPRTSLQKEGVKPFVPMTSLSESSLVISEIEERSGNGGTKFINGDTLFARITPCLQNGKIGYVQFLTEKDPVGFGSTEFIVLRKNLLPSEFIYCLARSEKFRSHAISSMAGADGRQRVKSDCFSSYYLAFPAVELLDQFSKFVGQCFLAVFNLSKKNKVLKLQRDMLLPKLISGDVHLED